MHSKFRERFRTTFREVILGGAQLIRGEAIKSIQSGPKSGRIYEKDIIREEHIKYLSRPSTSFRYR